MCASAAPMRGRELAAAVADIRHSRQRRQLAANTLSGIVAFPARPPPPAAAPVVASLVTRPSGSLPVTGGGKGTRTKRRPDPGQAVTRAERRSSRILKPANDYSNDSTTIALQDRPVQPVIESPLHVATGPSHLHQALKRCREPRDAVALFLSLHAESQPEGGASKATSSSPLQRSATARLVRPVDALAVLDYLIRNIDFNRAAPDFKNFLDTLEGLATANHWPAPVLLKVLTKLGALRSRPGVLAFWRLCAREEICCQFSTKEKADLIWLVSTGISRANVDQAQLRAVMRQVDVDQLYYGSCYYLVHGLARLYFGGERVPEAAERFPQEFARLLRKCGPRLLMLLEEKIVNFLEANAAGSSHLGPGMKDNDHDENSPPGGDLSASIAALSKQLKTSRATTCPNPGRAPNAKWNIRLLEAFGWSGAADDLPKLHFAFIRLLDADLGDLEHDELGRVLDVFREWSKKCLSAHGLPPVQWLRAKKKFRGEKSRPRKENYGGLADRSAKHIWEFMYKVEQAMKMWKYGEDGRKDKDGMEMLSAVSAPKHC